MDRDKCFDKDMKNVFIDCDNTMGIKDHPMDDALAILYLLGCDDVFVAGIGANYGNGTVAQSYACSRELIEELGLNIPLFAGHEQGEEGISEAGLFIARYAAEHPGQLIYLGIGSLGNLYDACLADSSVFDNLKQVVLMGGATAPLFMHGKPLDELNFSINHRASDAVLRCARNLSVISGNNCLPVADLPKEDFLKNLCSSGSKSGMYVAKKCGYRFAYKKLVYGVEVSYCWDGVAAAYITHPEMFTDDFTPCLISDSALQRGYLDPCSREESNSVINLPRVNDRNELQGELYRAWLNLNIA